MSSFFAHGKLHSPYFIFLCGNGDLSDRDLLQRFSLPTYDRTASPSAYGPYAILADDGTWNLVADDWRYTLWHMPSTRIAIAELAAHCDVFACSVGDIDHSYDIVYYRNSQLIRKFVVEDRDFKGGSVVENLGKPLLAEQAVFKQPDELQYVLDIASSLGIKTRYCETDLRIYCPPQSAP